MNCKNCGNPLDENKLVCQGCGYQGPLMEERERLESLREKKRTLIFDMAKKPIFLAAAIALSAASVISIFSASLLEAIFMIISAVGLWSCYMAKDGRTISGSVRNASLFDAYNRVMFTISAVLSGLLFAGLAALLFAFSADGSGTLAELSSLLQILAVVFLVLGVVSVVINLLFRGVYKKRRLYFLEIGKFTETGIYEADRPSVAGSYVIGVITALGGLSSLGTSLLSTTVLVMVNELLSAFSSQELAELVPMIEMFLSGFFGGLALGGIAKLGLGLYYILYAVWMSSVHEQAVAFTSAIDHQNVRRLDLERRSKVEYEEWQSTHGIAEEAPESDEPTADEPAIEMPTVEMPADEPVIEMPTVEMPTVEMSAEEPVIEMPTVGEKE